MEVSETKSVSKRILPNTNEIQLGLVFALNIAWVSANFNSVGMFGNFAHAESLLDAYYLISIISVTLTLIIAGWLDNRTGRLLANKHSIFVLSVGTSLSSLMLLLLNISSLWEIPVLIVSGTLSGILSGLWLILIGSFYCRASMRNIVIATTIAYIGSAFLFSLNCIFSPLEGCIFASSLPAISGILLVELNKSLCNTNSEGSAAPKQLFSNIKMRLENDYESRTYKRTIFKLIACSTLFGFVSESLRTVLIQMGMSTSGKELYALSQSVIALVITAGAIAIAAALVGAPSEQKTRRCYHALIAFVGVSLIASLFPFIYSNIRVYFPFAINAASRSCFGMFVWIVLIGLCQRSSEKCIRAFSWVRAGWAFGPLLGLLLGRLVIRTGDLSIQSVFPVIMLACVAFLIITTYVFTESDMLVATNLMPTERKAHFKDRCGVAIKQYKLSEREGEVLFLLAKGHSLARIQEILCLSKSTVSTHRQSIYQKMNIHSQQELIDTVQLLEP